jgi:hypothetical protein
MQLQGASFVLRNLDTKNRHKQVSPLRTVGRYLYFVDINSQIPIWVPNSCAQQQGHPAWQLQSGKHHAIEPVTTDDHV